MAVYILLSGCRSPLADTAAFLELSKIPPYDVGGPDKIATVKGERLGTLPKTLNFSGYEWEVRQNPSSRGSATNSYDAANVWTDSQGKLHLRISKSSKSTSGWSCSEVNLRRSLGYGYYLFEVRETSRLEPAAVLGLYTRDDLNADHNHQEMDIEISRWGDPVSKNSQYVIQPNYVPVNVFRFMSPSGFMAHSFHWEPGRVTFRSTHGKSVMAEHRFTSGVPSPGGESVRMSFYVYDKTRTPMKNEAEVVIEKFEYLP